MTKTFTLPEKEYTAEIFKPKIQRWVDIVVTATSADEAQEKIYFEILKKELKKLDVFFGDFST